MPYIQVDVDMHEFDEDDLTNELGRRGHNFGALTINEVKALAEKYRFALYKGDDAEILKATEEYFNRVHGIGF